MLGSVAAVVLLAAGCGSGTENFRTANAEQPAASKSPGGGGTNADGYGSGSGYGSGAGSGYGADAAADPAAGTGNAAAGAKGGPAGQLAVRAVQAVGNVVTDGAGATLYRFDKDTAQPPKSACDGTCATTWPAVPADDATASAGIDANLLGAVVRPDGTRQLTLAGWPVYRYAQDARAGEAKGEGVGGTWHALAADGKKAIDQKMKGMDMGSGQMGQGQTGADQKGSELSVTNDGKLGNILVDGQSRTLYRFNNDSAWPMKFGCLGGCLDTWKPAAPVDKKKVKGIPEALVGSVKRPDGTMQLTIDCWPVYTFTGDTAPGQTNGHNKQGLWFAVTDAGKKAPAAG
ncbi:SCO0930 family lipoprotein [Streptomyces sp. NBC_00536]|uniref:SCO0930 family lipoprotein n=1 Tax=Streptomyces sp. NBC_00536 TaxID=2975769 RepID=UPI002E804D57|nr:SCO0930 family lipoprotein [Streptomyces sp. NBC_00536]WUC83978.1 SCO0930 family lipoprotein [Streptomyces sp. NBC_00536]